MKVLIINPGSTSTKVAVYTDGVQTWVDTEHHSPAEIAVFSHINEQLAYREDTVRRMLAKAGIPMEFDAIMARGGLLQPTPGGVYAVDDTLMHDLTHAHMEHACNLGALIADKLAKEIGCPAFIADPEVVDEFMPEARLSGIPEIERISIFHALNQKAVARKYARENGIPYNDLNLIVVHLGGGISVGAHR
ncbi:MAG: butyrate kinase, partial [Muribaculaceae bacterium]|nr:butyrate kinase [Muribaculaceae bacterium]